MKMRMNKMIITLAATLSVVAVLCACDDTITKITNPDVQTVATYKDLAKCSGKNEGELYFVKDSGAVYLCSERAWKKTGASSANESESKNGTDSKNGRSCTVSALKDGAGYDIICAGKKIGTILNGVDGAKGDNGSDGPKGDNGPDGDDGTPGSTCSTKELLDGSGYELSCDGKVVGIIKNGKNGKKGKNGTACSTEALEDGSGYELSCDGEVVGTIMNGSTEDADCSFDDDGKGTVTITCGDEEGFELPLALCGSTPYDPSKKVCLSEVENMDNGVLLIDR